MENVYAKNKKNYLKRGLVTALIFVLALTLLTGCGEEKEETSLEKTTVVLDWTPNTNHTGLYVALEKGYYEEEGLDVEIIQPSDGTAEALVGVGKADFGVSYQENVTYALTGDSPIPITAIAAVIQHNTSGFAAPVEKDITRPKDFEGHTYGGWGSPAEEAIIRLAVEQDGGDFDQVKIVTLGQDDFFTAVKSSIDFAWVYEATTLVQAEIDGVELDYIPVKDLDPALDYYTPVLIGNNQVLQNDPDKAKAFLAATAKGYEYTAEHPEESAEILLKYAPELDETLTLESQKYLADKYIDDASQWGIMKESVWEAYGTLAYENGLIGQQLDVKAAFTNDYLPKA